MEKMKEKLQHVLPADIEKTSFSIIRRELQIRGLSVPDALAPVVFRVIHTTADFEYAETMTFSEGVMETARQLFRSGAHIVTDTTMAYAGINKRVLASLGGDAVCYIADPEVAEAAGHAGITRSASAVHKAAKLQTPTVYVVGNAPTALIALHEEISRGYRPALVIGVPVGFVNVEYAKELILADDVPCIVNRGRKGGSNVAAAICNAILYEIRR